MFVIKYSILVGFEKYISNKNLCLEFLISIIFQKFYDIPHLFFSLNNMYS